LREEAVGKEKAVRKHLAQLHNIAEMKYVHDLARGSHEMVHWRSEAERLSSVSVALRAQVDECSRLVAGLFSSPSHRHSSPHTTDEERSLSKDIRWLVTQYARANQALERTSSDLTSTARQLAEAMDARGQVEQQLEKTRAEGAAEMEATTEAAQHMQRTTVQAALGTVQHLLTYISTTLGEVHAVNAVEWNDDILFPPSRHRWGTALKPSASADSLFGRYMASQPLSPLKAQPSPHKARPSPHKARPSPHKARPDQTLPRGIISSKELSTPTATAAHTATHAIPQAADHGTSAHGTLTHGTVLPAVLPAVRARERLATSPFGEAIRRSATASCMHSQPQPRSGGWHHSVKSTSGESTTAPQTATAWLTVQPSSPIPLSQDPRAAPTRVRTALGHSNDV